MDGLHNDQSDVQETIQSVVKTTESPQWFVMRDLKRGNAKQPAYKLLDELKIRFFTPMVWKLTYIIHSGFISGYQNRYGDNLKPPTNVYHRMTA